MSKKDKAWTGNEGLTCLYSLASANIPFTRENLICANVTFTWGNCVHKQIHVCLPGKSVRANEPHSFKTVCKCAATVNLLPLWFGALLGSCETNSACVCQGTFSFVTPTIWYMYSSSICHVGTCIDKVKEKYRVLGFKLEFSLFGDFASFMSKVYFMLSLNST